MPRSARTHVAATFACAAVASALGACQALLVLDESPDDKANVVDASVEAGDVAVDAESENASDVAVDDARVDSRPTNDSGASRCVLESHDACNDFNGAKAGWSLDPSASIDTSRAESTPSSLQSRVPASDAGCSYSQSVHRMTGAHAGLRASFAIWLDQSAFDDGYAFVQAIDTSANDKCQLLTGFRWNGVDKYQVHLLEQHFRAGTPYEYVMSTNLVAAPGQWVHVDVDANWSIRKVRVVVDGNPVELDLATCNAAPSEPSVAVGIHCMGAQPVDRVVWFDDVTVDLH